MRTLFVFLYLLSSANLFAQTSDGKPQRVVYKEVTLNASPELIWQKWTTEQGIKSMLGVSSKIELEIGGAYEIYFDDEQPVGLKGSEGCKVLSYLPNHMLSFSWSAPPKFPQIRNGEYHTWVVVELEPLGNNKTKVKLTHLGWKEGEQWDQVYAYFDVAWGHVMTALEASVK
jgi:uncharacterized protein YndB with AHSA1/START domain